MLAQSVDDVQAARLYTPQLGMAFEQAIPMWEFSVIVISIFCGVVTDCTLLLGLVVDEIIDAVVCWAGVQSPQYRGQYLTAQPGSALHEDLLYLSQLGISSEQ